MSILGHGNQANGVHNIQSYVYLEKTISSLFTTINLNLSKPIRTMLTELIVCFLENNKAHISKMGENIYTESASAMACIQRIRRFLSNKRISPSITVIPLIHLMRPLLERLPEIVLIMDHTEWEKRLKYINILSVAVSYKGRALPLFWIVFGRKGCSSFEQWKYVLTPVVEGLRKMDWFFDKLVHVLGDREFGSPKLAEWLKCTYDIDSTLRIKSNICLNNDYTPETKVATLIENMVKGLRHILYNQTLTSISVCYTEIEDSDIKNVTVMAFFILDPSVCLCYGATRLRAVTPLRRDRLAEALAKRAGTAKATVSFLSPALQC